MSETLKQIMAERDLSRAITALYLEVDESIVNDIRSKVDAAFQPVRDERDRLLKIVEYGAAIDNALFMRGEHVETYEARCRYLADRCRKLLAALTPAGQRLTPNEAME